jgi:hypothetical protein
MRSFLIAVGLSALLAGAATAQAGFLGVFRDPGGTVCSFEDRSPGIVPFHVVHVGTGGATACQYSAPKPDCLAATFLSDTNVFPVTIGGSQGGVSIGYGTCRTGPIHVQTISYFTMGTTGACCYYPVLPDPAVGVIGTVDCSFNPSTATGGKGIVNSNATCTCNVPAEDTTWGGVKALYTE